MIILFIPMMAFFIFYFNDIFILGITFFKGNDTFQEAGYDKIIHIKGAMTNQIKKFFPFLNKNWSWKGSKGQIKNLRWSDESSKTIVATSRRWHHRTSQPQMMWPHSVVLPPPGLQLLIWISEALSLWILHQSCYYLLFLYLHRFHTHLIAFLLFPPLTSHLLILPLLPSFLCHFQTLVTFSLFLFRFSQKRVRRKFSHIGNSFSFLGHTPLCWCYWPFCNFPPCGCLLNLENMCLCVCNLHF